MNIPKDRLKEFKTALKKADFDYQYAEGDDYYHGRDSIVTLGRIRGKLIEDFPENTLKIEELYRKYRG